MTGTAPIAVALDARDLETASEWARAVEPHVTTLKIGLELFCRYGPDAVASVRGGSRIELFLDLKLNDIPNTVAGAVRSVSRLRPTYLTVHALGGRAMIAAGLPGAGRSHVPSISGAGAVLVLAIAVTLFAGLATRRLAQVELP